MLSLPLALAVNACSDGVGRVGPDAVQLRLSAELSESAAQAAQAVRYDSVTATASDASGAVVGDTTVVVPGEATSVEILLEVVLSRPTDVVTVAIQVWATDLLALEGTSTFPVTAADGVTSAPPVVLAPVAPVLEFDPAALDFVSLGANPQPILGAVRNAGGGTLDWTSTPVDPWLATSANGGSLGTGAATPLTVSVDASGLTEGTHTTSLTFDAPGALGVPASVPVTLLVNRTPAIGVAPTALIYNAIELSSPPAQALTLMNSGGGTLNWRGLGDQSWMFVQPGSGALVGGDSVSLTVAVTSDQLAPGSYAGSITFTDPSAANSPVIIPVSLTVAALPRWNLQIAGAGSGSGTITSTPAGVNCTISNGVPSGTCNVPFIQGTAVTLIATPALGDQLSSWGGACSGAGGCAVTMNGPTSVTVTFAPAPPTLSVSPSALSFQTFEFFNPQLQTLTVTNVGSGSLLYTVSSNQPWMTVVQQSTAPLGTGQSSLVDVLIQSDTMSVGTRSGLILVTNLSAQNDVVPVNVTLVINPCTGSCGSAPPRRTVKPSEPKP